MRLTDLLALSHVPRWSIVSTLHHQTVSDHTFRVAVITQELAGVILGRRLTGDELWYILTHDGSESRSADIPSNFKSRLEPLIGVQEIATCPWLTDEGELTVTLGFLNLFRIADQVEAYTFIRAWGWGSHSRRVVSAMRDKVVGMCKEMEVDVAAVLTVIDHINNETER